MECTSERRRPNACRRQVAKERASRRPYRYSIDPTLGGQLLAHSPALGAGGHRKPELESDLQGPILDADAFLLLAEALTGTPVKEVTDIDRTFLNSVLADDARTIDCSQLNELLLLVNKDRV